MRVTSSGRRLARVLRRVKASRIDRVGAHVSPPVVAGFVVQKPIVGTDLPAARQTQDTPAKEREGTETDLSYPNRYKRRSCTCKIGWKIGMLYLWRDTKENRLASSPISRDDRTSQAKVKKCPNTPPMTCDCSGGTVPTHAADYLKKTWPSIARRVASIALVIRKKGKHGYTHAVA